VHGVRARAIAGPFRPIGSTDSEAAFCVLLNELHHAFPRGYPAPEALTHAVAAIGAELGARGVLNFLMADGKQLFARCATKLCYIIRKAPFTRATLADEDLEVDFSAVTTPRDRVAIVATAPLTRDETWTTGKPGEMWVFRRGRLAATLRS
jgi:glutamine amidotransferase